MRSDYDVIVIGGGIAGIALAAELSLDCRVLVLEQEEHPGTHATGRSAALYSRVYGNGVVRRLTRASEEFFLGSGDARPFATKRPWLHIAQEAQFERLDALAREPNVAPAVTRLSGAEACSLVPVLRLDYVAAALFEEDAYDLDVDAILGSYLKRLKLNQGVLHCSAAATKCVFDGSAWMVSAGGREYRAPILVNAGGAWGDVVARQAGIAPIGLEPKRRSVLLVDPPAGIDPCFWPFVIDVDEQFYFKPDAGKILMSPADETPTEPCDAYPEDLDLATAVERVQQAADIPVRRLSHSWAGLRTFAPDRTPVVGFDPEQSHFFWLVGQGGYGIQTAPALSRAAAALVRGASLPPDLVGSGLTERNLLPGRLRAGQYTVTGDQDRRGKRSVKEAEGAGARTLA